MVSPIDSSVGKVDYYEIYANIDINPNTVCDGIFTIYTQDNANYYRVWIILKSQSNTEKSASKSQ